MQRTGRLQKTIPRPDRSQYADRLSNPVRIEISGDGSSDSVQFDGSQGIELNFTLADVNDDDGTFGDAEHTVRVTVDAKGRITAIEEVAIASSSGSAFAPLTTGAEPIVLVSDGLGQCIMVPI